MQVGRNKRQRRYGMGANLLNRRGLCLSFDALHQARCWAGGACKAVRSQAEPGNEAVGRNKRQRRYGKCREPAQP